MQCEKCHGKNGDGFGMIAWSLRPKPYKFFVQKTIRKVLDGQILWTIKNGVRHTLGDIENPIFRLIASKKYITPLFFPIPLF